MLRSFGLNTFSFGAFFYSPFFCSQKKENDKEIQTVFWKSLGLNSYSLTIKGEEDTIKEKIFNKFITLPMSSPNKVFFAIYRTESF